LSTKEKKLYNIDTWTAEILLANMSGTEVPMQTRVMALTESRRLMKQPRWPATSPAIVVTSPTKAIEMKKQG
jgi:hypothetical protein